MSFIDGVKNIVTPSVRRETKRHFGCDTVEGCPLENHIVVRVMSVYLVLSGWCHLSIYLNSAQNSMVAFQLTTTTLLESLKLGLCDDQGMVFTDRCDFQLQVKFAL